MSKRLRLNWKSVYLVPLLCGYCGAQPQITSVTPKIAKVGVTSQTITILGSGLAGCGVIFNGAPLTVGESTNASITTTIPAASLAAAGTFELVVACSTGASVERDFVVSDTGVTGVNLVLGFGSLLAGKATDYKVNSTANVLEGTSIGNATPQLMAGVDFRLPIPGIPLPGHPGRHNPWDVFVSLKFAPGTNESLDGFVFGISYRIASHLSVLAGFALSPFNEPAPGFKLAAINAVNTNTNKSLYAGYSAASLQANGPGAYDGFPLLQQPLPGSGGSNVNPNLYPGDPLETQYRPGLILGVSVPISFGSFLGAPQ